MVRFIIFDRETSLGTSFPFHDTDMPPEPHDTRPRTSAGTDDRSEIPPSETRLNHEAIKNLVQAAAVLVAGLWIGTVWLYENWAAQYFEPPFATLDVAVERSGRFEDGSQYAVLSVKVSNISKRWFFNYANAITVRELEFTQTNRTDWDMDAMGEFITDIAARRRPWVAEKEFERDRDNVLAYSQFMSQGYAFQPSESYSSLITMVFPADVRALEITARVTYGAAKSLLDPSETVRGGLAIDGTGDLAACIASLEKRNYQTPCDQDYSSKYIVRSAYAHSSYVFPIHEEEDEKL